MKNLEHSASVKRTRAAEQWYNENNRNVSGGFIDSNYPPPLLGNSYTKLALDDPPFYLRNSKSLRVFDGACAVPSDQSSERHSRRNRTVPQMRSLERTIEELRSVIDDLTVRNKKLRQKLRRYDKLHCSHLRKEVLFEVRMHGLQSSWKRKLEHTLRSFASNLEDPTDGPTVPHQASLSLQSSNIKLASSSTNSHPVDSAYASISASGQTFNSQSARNDTKVAGKPIESIESNRKKVYPRWHDIQQGLLPQTSRFMSEHAKQKLVVKRLEQLFTGRSASTAGYQSSLQQQELSHFAAKADRSVSEAGGHLVGVEGMREARILPAGTELPTDFAPDEQFGTLGRHRNNLENPKCGAAVANMGATPEQRPTRPLDLDMYRAQIPGEAAQYVQHLGLASPRSWIYLNLLSNMAQLHAFDVTAEFVRKAVARLSSRLEISANGQKLRWKGDDESAGLVSESASNMDYEGGHSPITAGRQCRTRERSLSRTGTDAHSDVDDLSHVSNHNNSSACSGATAPVGRPDFLGQFSRAAAFQYKPLFFQGTRSDDEDDILYDSDSVNSRDLDFYMTGEGANSKGPGTKARPTSPEHGSESGPIIFFNGVDFCTDLSGDTGGCSIRDVLYSRFTDKPVGCELHSSCDHDLFSGGTRRPLMHERNRYSVVDDGSDLSMTEIHLTIEQSDPTTDDDYDRLAPIHMEASGLGGVQPQDNFSIHVQVQHGRNNNSSRKIPPCSYRSQVRRVLQNVRDSVVASTKDRKEAFVEARILSASTKMLLPSTLPEPSYRLALSSEDEDSYDESDDSSKGSEDGVPRKPSTISSMEEYDGDPSSLNLFLAQSDDSSHETPLAISSEDDSEEEDDDTSIDLLAHARVLDPDTIATREREFDDNNGQMLTELPAGSSAATAGGYSSERSGSLVIEDVTRPIDLSSRSGK